MPDQHKSTVVVTGGSRGIGRAICIALAGPKTRIFFNYFSPVDPEGEAAAAAETIKAVADAGSEFRKNKKSGKTEKRMGELKEEG
jgi:3-oxoacyl-[acyl-carrier protein] reductase